MNATVKFIHNKSLSQKAYLLSLLLFCVSIFLPMQLATNSAIALLIVIWLAEGKFAYKLSKIKSSPLAAFSIILFLLYLIGMLYTQNVQAGWKYLETKASLLIFPLVLTSAIIPKEDLHKTLRSFSWLCVFFSLIALLYQIKVVEERNDINYLFSDGLVLIYRKQAIYYALYVALSILVFFDRLWFDNVRISKTERIINVIAISFLLLILFLLASRTSLLVLILILFTTAVVKGVRNGKLKYTALLIAATIVFFGTLSFFFPQTLSRFESLKNTSYNFQNKSSEYHFAFDNAAESWNGLNLRLAKWVCALDVIKENPVIGVGSGDIKDALVTAYTNRSFFYAVEMRFDPHNQYLETTVGIGAIGLLVLCLFYFYPLYLAVRKRNWLFSAFTVMVIFCSLTESILSSSQGIIFTCFFMFIFVKMVFEDDILITREG
ncbi:O-antigen ligase family protein [Pontibacter pamirensis]|uniref:O-antigen ligase family protein n=1 Tax=Pontibacter pamirensis TaxID=2562824 RepID=UPI0013894BB4|nr:O-antigen ligase family protein [Pontibacter pamirensis]